MKNYLVIGASSGIGKQLAMQLAGENARVFGTFFKNEIQFSHPNISFHQLNVLDENAAC